MSPRIPYTKPSITELEVAYATDAVRNGWGERCYDYIGKFEAAFAAHLGVTYAISTSSCTGALHMGMAALGIGAGDEVILADTNWIASAAPIVHLGATPIFVDIDPVSWCLDPAKVEKAITSRTKAILAVHIYGNLCDMDQLHGIADRHGVILIEDAAEAIGSVWKGRRAGSIGRFGAFSFHGTKTLTTGEGGMFVTSNSELFEKVLTLSNHGRAIGQTRQFWPEKIGFKYKMSNVQAAIGLGQVERIDELVTRKREIMQFYRDALAHYDGLSLNPEPPGTENGSWMPTVVFDHQLGVSREAIQAAFKEQQIDARVFFHPLSSLPMFSPVAENVNAQDIAKRAINLPSFHEIQTVDLLRVLNVIDRILQ